jgi:uncharacterized lipoprotein YddW (UPF0748 family)
MAQGKRRLFAAAALSAAAALAGGARADLSADQTPFSSFRGLWVSRFEYSQSNSSISTIMANAQSMGITDVFFQVRGQADAYYNSAHEVRTNTTFDSLSAAVTQANNRGIKLHAWINTMPLWQPSTPSTNPNHLMNKRPEFWVRDSNNNVMPLGSGYVTVNGTRADVQQHINNVVQDIATKYNVAGVHLDYIRNVSAPVGGVIQYPADPETVGRFQALPGNGSKTPTSHPAEYRQFIADGITALVSGVRQTLKATRPAAQLTAAVWRDATIGFNDYQQQWNTWVDRGLLDAAMPMIYFENSTTTFPANVTSAVQHRGNSGIMPGIGVYLQDEAANTYTESYNNVTYQLNKAKDSGSNGVTIYSYSSVFGTSQASQGIKQALTDFFAANNAAPAPTVINNFDVNEGYFAFSPTASGSNSGVASATANRVTTQARAGAGSQELVINKSGSSSEYFVRHLSGIGTAGEYNSNLNFASIGTLSLWLKTTTPDVQVSIALDDTATGDRGYWKNVIADGEWHQYEWSLNDVTLWDSWAGGNGQIGERFAVDSVHFKGTAATTTLYFDELTYNAAAVAADQWRFDGSESWQNAANWQGPVPNAVGATANLFRRATGNSTITLASNITLGRLNIDNNAASYTVGGNAQISFDVTSGSAEIDVVNRGTHTISTTTVRLLDNLIVDVDRASTLSISSNLTSTVGRTLTKTNDGTLNLAGTINLTSGSTLAVAGGVLNLSASAGALTAAPRLGLTVSGGEVNVSVSQRLTTVTVGAGGEMNLTGSGQTLAANTLTVSGLLDSGTADLLVTYSGGSPIAALIAAIASGNIVSAGEVGGLSTYLAVAEAADLGLTEFNGITIDDTTVILKHSYVGDANLDGQVDALDYERIDLAIGNTGVLGVAQGDLNYDGTVDALDYEQVDLNIGNGVGGPLGGGLGAVFVPEPTGAGLLLGAVCVLARRRRV